MDEKTLQLFDDYLQGALSVADQKALEERIAKEPALADAFVVFRELNGHLEHQLSEERSAFKSQLDSLADAHLDIAPSTQTIAAKETKVIKFKPMRYLVAASVAILFGALFILNTGDPNYEDYAFDGEISLVARDGGDIAFAKAEEAFNNKSYEEAIAFFDSILSNDPRNAEILYYKGIALVEILQFDEADALFARIGANDNVFKYKAIWYGALSKLKQKDNKGCIALLKTIPSTAEDYEKAQELLDDLD